MTAGTVVMVGGGKGGVGKSTTSAALARAFARKGLSVAILDGDLAGPSQAILFHATEKPEIIDGLPEPCEVEPGIWLASSGLVARGETALVWSDETAVSAIGLLLASDRWNQVDVVVVDLPPGQGRVTVELAQRFPDARCVLVTTGSPLALEECARAATFLGRMELDVAGIVQNMAFVDCPRCGARSPLHGGDAVESISEQIGVELLARLPFDPTIDGGPALDAVADALTSD